jgi:hypothetical protein
MKKIRITIISYFFDPTCPEITIVMMLLQSRRQEAAAFPWADEYKEHGA